MNYEPGKQYEMRVIDIRKDSAGYDYVALYDNNNPDKEFRIYNILKCQYESLPETMYVQLKRIDEFGRPKFFQDEERLYRDHYKVGKFYAFEVTDVREDFNTKAQYYIVEDDFASHRYYFDGEQKFQLGQDCILEVEGYTDKGFLKLKEKRDKSEVVVESAIPKDDTIDQRVMKMWNGLPVLDMGEESYTLEYKTSIVFTPDGKANIDKQLIKIVRELAGFMNARGGKLYIGITDKEKKLVGIGSDYDHLNDGEDDYTYSKNNDGYQLKIRNTIDRLCPSVANRLVDFEFGEKDGRPYCVIDVKPAKRPIFMRGNMLFERQGNRIKQLMGDEITFFVTERMTVSIQEMVDPEGNSMDINAMKDVMRELLNERYSNIPTTFLPKKQLGEIDYWIIWYNDGSWKRQREHSEEAEALIQVPVYKEQKDELLVFCYPSSKVNVIKLTEFRRGANMNVLQSKQGWSKKEKPMNIFLMHPTDFLVGYSIDNDSVQHVKLHSLSDYRVTSSAGNEGSPFLPQLSRILNFAVLSAEHRRKVAHLIVPKAQKTVDAGTALTSVQQSDELEYLKKTLEQKS